ncbi:MAG: hypothetical protein MK089_12785 [Phycisphaerales bacterium]|nr:hypothetical protein [Phycisphaerales bacterium]
MIRRVLLLVPALLFACETTRIEYRKTPAFYSQMADVQGLEGGMNRDGTEIRFLPPSAEPMEGFEDSNGNVFRMREQGADGVISLNALVPEHVLLNTLACLKNQEYQLLWDEMVCNATKQWYEEEGGGEKVAIEFFRVNRQDIVTMLMRMRASLNLQEVERFKLDDGTIRFRLARQISHRFVFSELDVGWEDGKFVLVTIR